MMAFRHLSKGFLVKLSIRKSAFIPLSLSYYERAHSIYLKPGDKTFYFIRRLRLTKNLFNQKLCDTFGVMMPHWSVFIKCPLYPNTAGLKSHFDSFIFMPTLSSLKSRNIIVLLAPLGSVQSIFILCS